MSKKEERSSGKEKILEIAHRGASGFAPENTKSAFLEAVKLGADAIEFDIHLTKDKKLVVIHDFLINRTSNGSGRVSKMTLSELRKYNFGVGTHREIILTLEEALKVINGPVIVVELKNSVKGYEELAIKAINKSNKKNKIWVHTANWKIIQNLRTKGYLGKLGYIVVFSLFHGLFYRFYKKLAKKCEVTFFSVDELSLNKYFIKNFIAELKKIKVDVYLWTVNDIISMQRAVQIGVDGIITNYPGILKKVLLDLDRK